MSKINEYITQGSDGILVKAIVNAFKVDPETAANKVQSLDFADYVELETAVKNNDEKKVSQILNIGTTEGANPYAGAPQQNTRAPAQPNSGSQNSDNPEDLLKKGDPVTFVDQSGERVEGEINDMSTTRQAMVKTPTGNKNVNPSDLALNTNSDDDELNRLKKLAGIEETSISGGATSGAINSGAIAGVVTPLNKIAKDNHKNQKPGPKPKKRKLIKR